MEDAEISKKIVAKNSPTQESTTTGEKGKELDSSIDELIKGMLIRQHILLFYSIFSLAQVSILNVLVCTHQCDPRPTFMSFHIADVIFLDMHIQIFVNMHFAGQICISWTQLDERNLFFNTIQFPMWLFILKYSSSSKLSIT